jgi:uncharacterized protein YjbI with pentapeptide repeats
MHDETDFTVIESDIPTRSEIEALSRIHDTPLWFKGIDLSGMDLSRLDLSDAVFERCAVNETRFASANLESTRWEGCRGTKAEFRFARLVQIGFEQQRLATCQADLRFIPGVQTDRRDLYRRVDTGTILQRVPVGQRRSPGDVVLQKHAA